MMSDINEANFKNGDRVKRLTGDEGKVIGVAQTGDNAGRVWVQFDDASQPTPVYPSSLTRLETPADELTAPREQLAAVTAERDAALAALKRIVAFAGETKGVSASVYPHKYEHWLRCIGNIARAALRAADALDGGEAE